MIHAAGSATDYVDLMDKLRAFLVANGWTVLQWTKGANLTSKSVLTIKAPGSAGGQQPCISMDTDWRTSDNSYSWRMLGHTTFDSGHDFVNQPGTCPPFWFNLWPNAMDYHFYCNDRHFKVFAKIGVIYMSCYAGFFLPYALPDEYPWPFYVCGTSYDLNPYTVQDARFRSFFDPGDRAGYYRRRETLDWCAVANSYGAGNVIDNPSSSSQMTVIWPWRDPAGRSDEGGNGLTRYLQNLRPNKDGRMPFVQAQIIDPSASARCIAGMLDGVFWTGGFNRAPEQTVTVAGTVYRIFPNTYRSTPRHFVAVEEGPAA